ncbi:Protein-methionine-sulfoxide reductase catalytic subunit MsrP [hydrothermal vent metagenome]|uniref:Protein-methionine-sulfoxide reductase catalytic subunit MsrP n=1 Tax=hydrothermal vent metagenome TaxID=652676 RepID=A0A3B0U0N1_9ZZZZ
MLIKHRRPWELPESQATSETVFLNRRQILAAGGGLLAAGAVGFDAKAQADPSAGLYPAPRNPAFTLKRDITPEEINSAYNNFYEFGSSKSVAKAARALPIRPWEISIDGEVEAQMTLGIDDLLKKVTLEERLYRLRCVEAWSMTIPWTGFPLARLVEIAKPLSSAKFLRMQTFENPKVARGQLASWYPWPYTEGLTMAEATNDLAFMVTGAYGKPAARQFGAPLRLAVPWKYGFKSVKSIVRFSFLKERPVTFWEKTNAAEYGFWANVNPKFDHPRWSQASERVLGGQERIQTVIFNGYGEQVADLYKGMTKREFFM